MRVPIAVIGALTALAVPTLAQAQKAPPNQLSISASKTTVRFGTTVFINGQLTGPNSPGETVELEANPFPFAGFKNAGTFTADPTGRYSFAQMPTANTRFRTEARTKPRTQSTEVTVNVALSVSLSVSDRTPRRGQRVTFSGSVRPAHDGQIALIQRRTSNGSYKTLARAILADAGNESSAYTRRLRIRSSGIYRIEVPSGDADHMTGVSSRRRLRVH